MIKNKVILMCDMAFKVGQSQIGKTQKTKKELFKEVWLFRLRKGYQDAIWSAYKAGLFAKNCNE